VGASLDDLERAYDDAKHGAPSRRPYLDATIPTLTDESLAPVGKHVMSIYVQYAPFRLKTGDWATRRGEIVEAALTVLEEHAPGLRNRVLAHHVVTPAELASVHGITGGHPNHGEHSLDQLFLARPLLGVGRYRAPLANLYLCGAGAHPGGGVTGAPGRNAAREILRDLKSR
jgi:phytoene dehydrogenase-like protein